MIFAQSAQQHKKDYGIMEKARILKRDDRRGKLNEEVGILVGPCDLIAT